MKLKFIFFLVSYLEPSLIKYILESCLPYQRRAKKFTNRTRKANTSEFIGNEKYARFKVYVILLSLYIWFQSPPETNKYSKAQHKVAMKSNSPSLQGMFSKQTELP